MRPKSTTVSALPCITSARGCTVSLDVLDGEHRLGRDFHIGGPTFKRRIGSDHTFAAIYGVLHLSQQHGLKLLDIAHIDLGVYQAAYDIAGYPTATVSSI